MIAQTPIPVRLEAGKAPTKQTARDIVGAFLTKEWTSVDPQTLIVSYHDSFTNAHCVVERPHPSSRAPAEPLKVFIKFHRPGFGALEAFRHLLPTKLEEARVCDMYSQNGSGAKVHGFFQAQDGTLGRVDEFLEARNMEPEDIEEPVIRTDVARALATFHVMQAPLEKRPVEAYFKAVIRGLDTYHQMDKLKRLGHQSGISIDSLVDYPFGVKLRKVADKLEAMKAKTGWCIHDVQFMNTMVKHDIRHGESRVALIDFEVVFWNYRAFDIGGHFMQKMFKWFDAESKIARCNRYTDAEKRHFCDAYARRWNALTGDADSGDQVFVEAEYGYLLAIAFDVHNMLSFMCEENGTDPLDLLGLNKLFAEFVEQYERLGLETS
ncbi:hypothetical protein XA68_17628 [Ophiocordyceps unilateralis]|uniref:Aminoglycoside phosphotransferase domain-containing protein n=1 Tax=Ophiocordyceps unilateralis TaxID=268505 RepID=A0A2A9PKI3_OPHUN|nr:hypothetical protein XA68_17628 [Ophiocordyceps unilateralis]